MHSTILRLSLCLSLAMAIFAGAACSSSESSASASATPGWKTVLSDDFNRTDTAANAAIGSNWTLVNATGNNVVQILSNQLKLYRGEVGSRPVIYQAGLSATSTQYKLSIKFTTDTDASRIDVRVASGTTGNNLWQARYIQDGTNSRTELVDQSTAVLATGTTFVAANSTAYNLAMECTNGSVTVTLKNQANSTTHSTLTFTPSTSVDKAGVSVVGGVANGGDVAANRSVFVDDFLFQEYK